MNLIDEVAKLEELCSDPCTSLEDRIAMKRTVPKLLDVLSEIRTGDARILAEVLSFVESEATESDWADAIEVLHRYRDVAKKMEENR